jgi:hypothetical protein
MCITKNLIMELNEQDIQLIKKHLFSRLNPADELEFQTRLARDQAFREELEFHQQLFAIQRDREHDRLKKMLQEVEQRNFSPQPPYARYLLWLGLLLLLAFLLWWFFLAPRAPSAEQLFAQHFVPYENTIEVSTRHPAGAVAKAAWKAYDAADYAQASSLFAQIAPQDRTEASIFFQANALLAADRAPEALALLTTRSGQQFVEESRWYAALAQLRLGNYGQSKQKLEYIASHPGHFKYQEAREILLQLNPQ